MRGAKSQSTAFSFFLFLHICCCSPFNYHEVSHVPEKGTDNLLPEISPSGSQQPFLPVSSPSPMSPFTNSTVPKLSGLCSLNFTAARTLMSMTAVDCYAVFAPYLANVICCPQLEATLSILIGQSSRVTNDLALNGTHAKHCLSDIELILESQGAAGNNLSQICSVHASNLTQGSCPIKDVFEFENTVDSSKLLAACKKIDPVKECCDPVCQNAILEAATKLALKASDMVSSNTKKNMAMDHSSMIGDCRRIATSWVASKLDALQAKEVLRGLSNCNINKFCPLLFPDMKDVGTSCGGGISNRTACCSAMEGYISHLQKQSFITNLQALDCAASMGMKLQRMNITKNVYGLCHISLKDFSLQAIGNQESGCLLPSLPSDATFDRFSGISFLCDLNDNIPAPWPSSLQLPASSCKNAVKIPALPAATSSAYNNRIKVNGEGSKHLMLAAFVAALGALS